MGKINYLGRASFTPIQGYYQGKGKFVLNKKIKFHAKTPNPPKTQPKESTKPEVEEVVVQESQKVIVISEPVVPERQEKI